jgi:hypothetical protein
MEAHMRGLQNWSLVKTLNDKHPILFGYFVDDLQEFEMMGMNVRGQSRRKRRKMRRPRVVAN